MTILETNYKNMKTSQLIALFIGAVLPFSACREAEPERPGTEPRYVDIPVSLGREDETQDGTRSIVDIEVENFQKAALFAFDAKTGTVLTYTGGKDEETVAAFPRAKNFSWSLIGTAEVFFYNHCRFRIV